MRQKKARREAYATMAGTNLSEPIVSRKRQFKQKYFNKKGDRKIYTHPGKEDP